MSKTNRSTGELPAVHPFLGFEVTEKDVTFGTDNIRLFFGKNKVLIPVI